MALNQFRDKNAPNGVPKYIFWPQKLVNGTWSAAPVNLIKLSQKLFPYSIPPKL